MALIGGAKISGKIDVLRNLISRVDSLVVGGGMAYTFQKAQGHEIGDSLLEKDKVGLARDLLEDFSSARAELILPTDHRVSREIKEGAETKVVKTGEIDPGFCGVDIGPETESVITSKIGTAGTVVWNGPLGIFEIPEFAHGTVTVARALAESGCISVVGGGDTAAAVRRAGLADRMTHISTGGGASLDLLGGKRLPGIEALTDAG
jgi:phosphoglycerate kinase